MTDTVTPDAAGSERPAHDDGLHLTAWPTVENLPDGVWVYHTAQDGHLIGAWGELVTNTPGRGRVWQACFVVLQDDMELLASTFEPGESFTLLPSWEEIAALRSRIKELEQTLAAERGR